MLKKALALIAALVIPFTMAGCSDNKGDSSSDLKTLNIGYMPNYASLATLVATIKTGAFEEQGFDAKLIEFADGPTIISAMESGSVDLAYIGNGAHKLAIQGKAEIIGFSQVSNADAVIGNVSKGVNTAADLKGKTVTYASGTSSEDILNLTLKKAGLTMKDIKPMEMDASAITTAMISGSVDACATWSPSTISILEELGDNGVKIADNKDFVDSAVSLSSFIVMPDTLENDRDTVVKYVKALNKGNDYRADPANIEQNCKWAAELTGLAYDSMYASRADADWQTSAQIKTTIENGELKKLYQVQQDVFLASEAITEAVEIEEYVHFDIMLDSFK